MHDAIDTSSCTANSLLNFLIKSKRETLERKECDIAGSLVELMELVIAREPNDWLSWLYLSRLYDYQNSKNGDTRDQKECIQRACELEPAVSSLKSNG
jgi:predicted Zn-dependent protease